MPLRITSDVRLGETTAVRDGLTDLQTYGVAQHGSEPLL